MSQSITLCIDNEDQLARCAAVCATHMQPQTLILLESDLGGGKTTFTRHLVGALGGDGDSVSSPTFTIVQEYEAADFHVYHYDLYRLESLGIVADELQEHCTMPDAVVVAEWPDKLTQEHAISVRHTVHLSIQRRVSHDTARTLTFTVDDEATEIADDLQSLAKEFSCT